MLTQLLKRVHFHCKCCTIMSYLHVWCESPVIVSLLSIFLLHDGRVTLFVSVLLCLFLSVGLGDGWGQSTRFSPLDSVAKELGSHLLQVSTGNNCLFLHCSMLFYTLYCSSYTVLWDDYAMICCMKLLLYTKLYYCMQAHAVQILLCFAMLDQQTIWPYTR